jgi:apolipoprotein N-acyltransferase
LGFLSLISFIPLIFVLKNGQIKSSLAGFIYGFIYYLLNLNWIVNAVNFYGNVPSFIGYMVFVFFISYLSIYFAIFGYICKKKDDIILLSFVFVGLEIAKSYLFTGFPWLNLGLTQYSQSIPLQWASVVGEFGISFFIIIINFLFYHSTKKNKKHIIASILTLILFYGGGYTLKNIYKNNMVSNLNIDIVQTNYKQRYKWRPDKKNELIKKVVKLFDKSILSKSQLTVLPEAAFPTFIEEEKSLFAYLRDLSKIKPILVGSLRYEGKNKYFNSAYFINNGDFYVYDKRHLVPFGEYFPLGNLLKPISYYFFGTADDFKKGKEQKVFKINNDIKISPLICYESAYSDLVPYSHGKISDIIILLTNDSWFGKTKGKEQHLALSVLRAVEYRRSFVRAAQSGISACIDSNGKIIKKIPEGEGILNCNIQIHSEKATFYAKYQYFWILLVILFIIYRQIKKR